MEYMTPATGGRSPEAALQFLKAGNERFVSSVCFYPPIGSERRYEVLNQSQQPYAAIVSCADSRVPVEIIFNAGIGDLYVVRVAGNVCAADTIGSIEFGMFHIGISLCVVLGHTYCNAVRSVLLGLEVQGSIPQLVAPILPAAQQVLRENPGTDPGQLLTQAVEANVWQGVENLLAHSVQLHDAVSTGSVQIVGAVYDLESGSVRWLGLHPQQEQLLVKLS